MKLPNRDKAIVAEAKIARYLLDLTHPVGRSKAVFFLAFGFIIEEWSVMADALIRHADEHDITKSEEAEDGLRYVIEGLLHTPDGRNPFVRTVWFVEKDSDIPRFVTAYPVKKRSS